MTRRALELEEAEAKYELVENAFAGIPEKEIVRNIFDSSTIMNLVRSKRFDVFLEGDTTPFAKYECISIVWEECKLYGKIGEGEALSLRTSWEKYSRFWTLWSWPSGRT